MTEDSKPPIVFEVFNEHWNTGGFNPIGKTVDKHAMLRDTLLSVAELAKLMRDANDGGGLHIIVADGNIEDESIEFCLNQTDHPLTKEEKAFACWMLEEFSSETRGMAYWLMTYDLIDAMNELVGEKRHD